jgi:hypothetical protein
MKPGPRYRLKRQTIAVSEDQHLIVDLPPGAEVVLLEPLDTSERNSQVLVEWQGRKLKMFGVNLKVRGERADHAAE